MNRKVLKGLGIVVFVLALMACSRRPEQTADNSAPVVQISKKQSRSRRVYYGPTNNDRAGDNK